MKKIAPIVMVALLAVAFTSCKKEYTCSCTFGSETKDIPSGTKLSKKDAKTWCEGYKLAGVTDFSCKLK